MIPVPAEAEQLIAMHHLGTPKKVYKPHTVASIIIGSFITTFACIWIILTLVLTQSPLLPTSQTSFQISTSQSPTNPPFSAPQASTDSPFSTPLTILGIVFSLFGLIFVVVGVSMIISALLNQNVRAVLCEYGVAQLGRTEADAFRWEEIATVLDKVNVNTSTTHQPDSFAHTHTTTTVSHTYTVIRKDGRRFIFNRTLGNVEQLGEEIQIAVALCQRSA